MNTKGITKIWELLVHQVRVIELMLRDTPAADGVVPWAIALVSGFGAGKSEAIHRAVVVAILRYPGASIALYAPTYDLLKLNNIPRIGELLDEVGLTWKFNKQDYIFTIEGYGNIICRSMDNPSRIIAYEVFLSVVDELDTLPLKRAEEAWNKIIARNRQILPSTSVPNKVLVASTPEGFNFIYKTWKKKARPGYVLVKAKTTDNPFLPENYIQSLRDSYPSQLIDAYINGEFVNLTGNRVYHIFNREDHEFSIEELLVDGLDMVLPTQTAQDSRSNVVQI
jgi:phage terminase large subunit